MTITPRSGSAAPTQAAPKAVVPTEAGIMELLNGKDMKSRLLKLLGEQGKIDRFYGLATSAIKSTPRLAECTQASVVGALLKSATLNLEPNSPAGQCWLIPRFNKNSGFWECSWELGYKGAIDLAYRSGEIGVIKAKVVHELDLFDIDYGKPVDGVCHKPYIFGDRGKVIGYWAQWISKDGRCSDPLFMSEWEMDQHVQQYVKSLGSEFSPWNTSYDQMALKTVIKRVLKYAPLSVDDMRDADSHDGTIIIDAQTGQIWKGGTKGVGADLLRAGPEEFSTGLQVARSEPTPMAVANPTPAQQPQAAEQEEAQRLDMVVRVREKIKLMKISPDTVLEKTGIPNPMIEKANLNDLTKAYLALQA